MTDNSAHSKQYICIYDKKKSKSLSLSLSLCSSGKYSDIGASQCIECDFLFLLSTRCEMPIMGIILIASVFITVTIAAIGFQRYKKKQERIKEKLRLDLHRQRQLVKTKQTDVNLLTRTL